MTRKTRTTQTTQCLKRYSLSLIIVFAINVFGSSGVNEVLFCRHKSNYLAISGFRAIPSNKGLSYVMSCALIEWYATEYNAIGLFCLLSAER